MKNNTIIRRMSRQKFIKSHLSLTAISVLIYISMFYEVPVVIYMLLAMFAPWISIIYEVVIVIGRLHDMKKTAILSAFIYLKVEIYLALLTNRFTYRELFFVGAYFLFIATLYIKEPKGRIKTN